MPVCVDFATDPCTSKWKTDLAIRVRSSITRRHRGLPERAAAFPLLGERFALAHYAVRKTAALYGTSRTRPSSRLTPSIAASQSSLVVVGVTRSPTKYTLTRNA